MFFSAENVERLSSDTVPTSAMIHVESEKRVVQVSHNQSPELSKRCYRLIPESIPEATVG